MDESNLSIFHDGILSFVEKPSRYIDCELNLASSGFGEDRFNVLLVFPDVYEIGMSHQGIRLLYHRLAGMEGVGVEFAFAPWPDCEKLLRASGLELRSWHTGTPASRFDVIGVSLTYELHYTNLLMVLELAGLDVEAVRRSDGDPLVIVGGPCCSNPLPILDAVDAVFLGDGEESLPEAVSELRELKIRGGSSRSERRKALAGIEGVYVDGETASAAFRTYDFREGDLPRAPIVPSSGIVHDRLAVEIMRGCARGCRFCHAGVVYRPRRERDVREIVEAVCSGLDASGWEEVSLLSLSTSDYSNLDELLAMLLPELEKRRVSLALPSLRPETVTERLVHASSLVRKSGFTLAPEAGTDRLRRAINKGMSDDEILRGCRRILDGGWQTLKLYFMIGLPTETEADLEGIVSLVERILALPRCGRRFKLAVSVSPFVPKPHTPFQWERQCTLEELREKEDFLAKRLRGGRVQLSLRDPSVSVLEGVLARGPRELWPVLVDVYRRGGRFDGWRDRFRFELWQEALEEHGLTPETLTEGFSESAELPWNAFEPKITGQHLLRERERAFDSESHCDEPKKTTEDAVKRGDEKDKVRTVEALPERGDEKPGVRYRCMYTKTGRSRFLAHLEILGILQRALRRSGLPVRFTKGFHPHPRISAGPSLAVGMEGLREFFDVELDRQVEVIPSLFDGLLPAGVDIVACAGSFSRQEGKLPPDALYRYRLHFGPLMAMLGSFCDDTGQPLEESEAWSRLGSELGISQIGGAFAEECLPDPAAWVGESLYTMIREGSWLKDRKGREKSIGGCAVREGTQKYSLELDTPATGSGCVRPRDMLAVVLPEQLAALVAIRRLEILYKTGDSYVDPLVLVDGSAKRSDI